MNGITSLLIRAALLVMATVAGTAPAAAQEVVEYIHTDALGSPVAITDATGNVIERTVYEPYGAVVNRPLKDGPGYTGHVTDSGTGLSYMQQRYYDAEIATFLSSDPAPVAADDGSGFCRYCYVLGNPYGYIDPDGREGQAVVGSRIKGSEKGFAGSRWGTVGGSYAGSMLKRHRTPASQERLIESVGGDKELLRYARRTHEEFVTSLIGIAGGGGLSFGRNGAKETVTLFRAVGPDELGDIIATRALRNLGSAEGKYFTTSAMDATAYGRQAVKSFGDAPYTIIRVDAPKNVLNGLSPASVDRGIPAWVVPNGRLQGLSPRVLNSSPVPAKGL